MDFNNIPNCNLRITKDVNDLKEKEDQHKDREYPQILKDKDNLF